MNVEIFHTVLRGEDDDEAEIELKIVGTYRSGRAGRTWGPPERCYEDEPSEAEIDEVLLDGKPWDGKLTPGEEEDVVEKLIHEGDNTEPPFNEPDDDDFDFDGGR